MGHGKGVPRHIKPMFKNERWRILRGDKVMIMAGRDKGQIGTVLKVIRNVRVPRIIVEGRNLVRLQFSCPVFLPAIEQPHCILAIEECHGPFMKLPEFCSWGSLSYDVTKCVKN
jgi:hypothetical protein